MKLNRRLYCVFFSIIWINLLLSAQAGETFVLNQSTKESATFEVKIPNKTVKILFSAVLAMPTSEDTVPNLILSFPENPNVDISSLTISDIKCTGEYHSRIEYRKNKKDIITEYFDRRIPWPEEISVAIDINSKKNRYYTHQISINGESKTYTTKKRLKKLKISSSGTAQIFDFDFIPAEKKK